jgi:hypothetical protein
MERMLINTQATAIGTALQSFAGRLAEIRRSCRGCSPSKLTFKPIHYRMAGSGSVLIYLVGVSDRAQAAFSSVAETLRFLPVRIANVGSAV